MPSRSKMEQCMTWLRSQAASDDILTQINAQVCIEVIEEYRKRNDDLGAVIGNLKRKVDSSLKVTADSIYAERREEVFNYDLEERMERNYK